MNQITCVTSYCITMLTSLDCAVRYTIVTAWYCCKATTSILNILSALLLMETQFSYTTLYHTVSYHIILYHILYHVNRYIKPRWRAQRNGITQQQAEHV